MLPSYDFPGNYVFYVAFLSAVAFFVYSVSVKVTKQMVAAPPDLLPQLVVRRKNLFVVPARSRCGGRVLSHVP